jgi:hypothetical protein
MKKILIIALVILPILGFSQSKKDIKANKIKATTVEKTELKDGVTVTYKETYEEYDKDGNTIVKIEYNKAGEIKTKENLKYDGFGNVSEKTEFDKKSGKTEKITYKYDANGEKTEEILYSSDGTVNRKQVFVKDSKGLKKETKEYNSKGELRWSKKYTYTKF